MSTSADRLRRRLQAQAAQAAKVAAAAARKRKATQMQEDLDQFLKDFDDTDKAIKARHQHDDDTSTKIIQGDDSWRKGQAISGSEEGWYPADAIEPDDCVGKARKKLAAWLDTKPSITGFVPYVPNGKLVWVRMAGKDVCAFEALLCASLFDEGALLYMWFV